VDNYDCQKVFKFWLKTKQCSAQFSFNLTSTQSQ
jgi:hypothetical protein